MADGADRREARRFTMSLPMRVLAGEARKSELLAHTRDVSYRGLYFTCETKFEIGTPIDFVITLPQQVTQASDVNIRCRGQILRVEPGANGHMGVAAKIEQYEFVQTAATSA
jgi:PilZ domain